MISTKKDVEDWAKQGLDLGAKYMFIVLDEAEAYPFFIFPEQEVVLHIYNIHRFFCDAKLLYVLELGKVKDNEISMVADAIHCFKSDLEN